MTAEVTSSRRAGSFTVAGTAKVVHFNWPKFVVVGVLGVLAGGAAAAGMPTAVAAPLLLVAGFGVVWSATSLVATWWVYDRSQVYEHVGAGLGPVGAWATVHAGFDDATATVAGIVGRPPDAVVNLMVPGGPSRRRARATGGTQAGTRAGRPDELPLASASLDTVFLTFAVHEVRRLTDQRALFAELHRSLRPGGRLIVTEHLLDLANVAVYGPGALHFAPRSTWAARAAEAGFGAVSSDSITPFVHRLVWRRGASPIPPADPDPTPPAAP